MSYETTEQALLDNPRHSVTREHELPILMKTVAYCESKHSYHDGDTFVSNRIVYRGFDFTAYQCGRSVWAARLLPASRYAILHPEMQSYMKDTYGTNVLRDPETHILLKLASFAQDNSVLGESFWPSLHHLQAMLEYCPDRVYITV